MAHVCDRCERKKEASVRILINVGGVTEDDNIDYLLVPGADMCPGCEKELKALVTDFMNHPKCAKV